MINGYQFVVCDSEKEDLRAILRGLEMAIKTAQAMLDYDCQINNHNPFPVKYDYGYDLVLGDFGIDFDILNPKKTEGAGNQVDSPS